MAMVILQCLVWAASAALTASGKIAQERADQEMWREIVRQKMEGACMTFMNAATPIAQALKDDYELENSETVVNQALALANPGIFASVELNKDALTKLKLNRQTMLAKLSRPSDESSGNRRKNA